MIVRNNLHSLYPNASFMTHLTFEDDEHTHSHIYFEFAYIVDGEIMHVCNKQNVIMRTGDIVLLRPGDIHTYRRSGSCTHRDVVITKDYFEAACNYLSPKLYSYIVSSPSCLYGRLNANQLNYFEDTLIHISNSLGSTQLDDINFTSLSCNALISSLLSTLIVKDTTSQATFPEWLKMLLERCTKKSYQVADMDTLLHGIPYSQTHICRTFKKYTHQTITEHINSIRLDNSRILLSNSTKPILIIAEELGFENPTYFTKLFKKAYGITPMQYRKQVSPPPRKK